MVQLSFAMMVKNESKYLERVLKSIQPIKDSLSCEIIVVDTGSDDNTVEIAKRYTEKVYLHEWNNDFAEMRNITLNYVVGEWLFILDGDEIIENPTSIIEFFLNGIHEKFNTAYVHIKNVTREVDGAINYNTTIIPRLFRSQGDFKYEGKVHEQPKMKKPFTLIDLSLLHYGYLATDPLLMEYKYTRNKKLIEKELAINPNNIYMLHQLFNTYSMKKDYKSALEISLKLYKVANKNRLNLKQHMYVYSDLAISYVLNNRQSDVEKICHEAINLTNGGYPDFYYYLAKAQVSQNKNVEATESFLIYLKTLKDFDNSIGKLDTTYVHFTLGLEDEVRATLCSLYYQSENFLGVIETSENIKGTSILQSILNMLVGSFIKLGEYSLLHHRLEVLKKEHPTITPYLYSQLENQIFPMDLEGKRRMYDQFSTGTSNYSLLCKTRLSILDNSLHLENEFDFRQMNFSDLPNYYGDLLYYNLLKNQPIFDLLQNVKERQINLYFEYLMSRNDSLSGILFKYIMDNLSDLEFKKVRILKLLCRYALSLNDLDDNEYQAIFRKYLELGFKYMIEVYNPRVFENQYVYDLKNDEEAFLIFMHHAESNKETNHTSYFSYLKKAILQYPLVKRGIERLVEEYQSDIQENNELSSYKKKIRESIQILIEASKLNDAIHVISEYEKINGDDYEIASLKGVTLLYQGDILGAEKVLLKGLEFNNKDADLFYNLGYINILKNRYSMAKQYFNLALLNTKDQQLVSEIKTQLSNIQIAVEEVKATNVSKVSDPTEISYNGYTPLSICIICFNAVEYTKICVESIRKYTKVPYKIHLLDNGSVDSTRIYLNTLRDDDDVEILFSDSNLGAPGGRNFLLQNSKLNEYVVFFDNDIELYDEWFLPFYEEMANDKSLGIIGIEGYDIWVNPPNRNIERVTIGKADIITGYCMFTTKEVVDKVGLFDEKLGLYWHEDDDFSIRAIAHGYNNKVIIANLIHHGSKSSSTKPEMLSGSISRKNLNYLTNKWVEMGLVDSNGKISSRKINVLLEGSLFVTSSLSKVNQELAINFLKQNRVKLHLKPIDEANSNTNLKGLFSSYIVKNDTCNIDIHIRHQWPPNFHKPKNGKLIINQPWEYGYIPKEWVKPMQEMVDEIWVPSYFNKKCFIDSGIPGDKVHVIPNGVNTDIYKPYGIELNLPTEKKFKFAFVGGTIWRKGIDILLESYVKTFTNNDDVSLVIKDFGMNSFYKGQTMSTYIKEIQRKKENPEIIYITDELTDEEMASFYRSIDCLVHPYRGEGFGMPITEAMACGKPAIVTNFGAALDFCNKENSFLIPARIGHLDKNFIGDIETVSNPYVGIADSNELSFILKDVYNMPSSYLKNKGEKARRKIQNEFTWENSIKKIMTRIDYLTDN